MPRMPASLKHLRRPGPLVALSLVYLLLVSGVMIWRGISVSPDYLLLILVPVALLSGRFVRFLRDWVPFLALFLGYEALAGVAPKTGIRPHYEFPIRIDKALFGGTDPSQWLQAHLGSLHWLAVACTVVYFGHFLLPIATGMVLWLVDRVQFLRFTVALLALSFAAFVVFVLVPVAPPWLADQHHLLPGGAFAAVAAQRGEPVFQPAGSGFGGGVPVVARGVSDAGRAGVVAGDAAGRGGGVRLVRGGVVQRGVPGSALRHRCDRRDRLCRGHLADHDAVVVPRGRVAAAQARRCRVGWCRARCQRAELH